MLARPYNPPSMVLMADLSGFTSAALVLNNGVRAIVPEFFGPRSPPNWS